MQRPVVLWIKWAICLANVLPPFFDPAQTQNSERDIFTSSAPVVGNRAIIGVGSISNFFVVHVSQDFIFANVHSDGSENVQKEWIHHIFEPFKK